MNGDDEREEEKSLTRGETSEGLFFFFLFSFLNKQKQAKGSKPLLARFGQQS